MTPAEILAAIPKLSALVVGDICLDRRCTYDQRPAFSVEIAALPCRRCGALC
jgi:hypothetical protein